MYANKPNQSKPSAAELCASGTRLSASTPEAIKRRLSTSPADGCRVCVDKARGARGKAPVSDNLERERVARKYPQTMQHGLQNDMHAAVLKRRFEGGELKRTANQTALLRILISPQLHICAEHTEKYLPRARVKKNIFCFEDKVPAMHPSRMLTPEGDSY